jgi:hypothetical protein
MGHFISAALAAVMLVGFASASHSAPVTHGHYLFAWTGDPSGTSDDFIAVIDGDPASAAYGHLITSASSGIKTQQVHHTEYWMPESGFLFANDHMAGRTVVMDLRDPLQPRVHASFGDLAGYSHPHSFLRLPNGHVLASFQVEGHMDHGGTAAMPMPLSMQSLDSGKAVHGGIVEIDDQGKIIRAASTADPERPNDLLMAYSLLPLPDIDRVLVTNSSMRDEDKTGHTYQIFRLSDLKRLSTNDLDAPVGSYGEINPEEARRGPDGSVFVQTTGCGIERISDIATDAPHAKLVYQFPGSFCGVPTLVAHYLIQTVRLGHAVVVIDIAAPVHPVEVSRIMIDGAIFPHWSGYDAMTHRIAVTGYGENRLFMLKFNPETGAIAMDGAFHDQQGRPGFDLTHRTWPHGWTGTAQAHGVVFSR